MNNNDLMIGVAGEHLVCFDLITKGFTAFMTEQGLPYDLIADIDGKLTRIQVKTTRTHSATPQRKNHYPSYTFNIRKCGKGGRSSYSGDDVDLFALVCVDTRQVGYVSMHDMPSTLSVRVDAFKGKYLNEVQEARANKVLELKAQGVTNTEIGKIVGMDKSVVGRVVGGKSKKTEHGVYFSDLTLEKAL
tara:strand:- start:4414 stop:4980 length:567 start_codon:yes stop_codon:yes gene_type:complete